MIHSTKNDQHWSFWYQWWSDHQDQDFFEEIGLLRPERLQRPPRSMRLQRFLRPEKSLLRSSKSSRFLISIIWGLNYLKFVFSLSPRSSNCIKSGRKTLYYCSQPNLFRPSTGIGSVTQNMSNYETCAHAQRPVAGLLTHADSTTVSPLIHPFLTPPSHGLRTPRDSFFLNPKLLGLGSDKLVQKCLGHLG